MPTIKTEHELKCLRRLSFCYLCGKPFGTDSTKDRDHVPPRSLFAKTDRCQPLLLPTHPACNQANSMDDEQIAQLVAVLHGKHPSPENLRLRFSAHRMPGSPTPAAAVHGINLTTIVFRWLRAFHAALYHEFLPSCGGYIHPPFPEGNSPYDLKPIVPIQAEYVKAIKKNRLSKTTDSIICWNHKCRYECVWAKDDHGLKNLCIFALDLYGWEELGDIHHHPARSCTGIYTPPSVPAAASWDTKLYFPFENMHPLSAFDAEST